MPEQIRTVLPGYRLLDLKEKLGGLRAYASNRASPPATRRRRTTNAPPGPPVTGIRPARGNHPSQ
ncbi:hypothetical protein [Streptomyces sp. T028]|uniref:hypothetical protein n=1 Tax=Streptomyces sp. T028 TaxID=3394379 RepID=UPI003A8851FE